MKDINKDFMITTTLLVISVDVFLIFKESEFGWVIIFPFLVGSILHLCEVIPHLNWNRIRRFFPLIVFLLTVLIISLTIIMIRNN